MESLACQTASGKHCVDAAASDMEHNRATWNVAGLVVAHVLLHAAALSVILEGMRTTLTWSPSAVTMYALFWLGPSQGILLGVWVALGGGRLLWRAILTTLAAILYAWCFSSVQGIWQQEWLIHFLAAVGLSGAVLLLARWAGLQLLRCSHTRAASGPFQYSIRDMLAWTTAVAVVLGAWRCLPAAAFDFLRQSIPAVAFISCPLVAVASMFFALGERWVAIRLVLLPATVILGAKLMCEVIPGPSWSYFAFLLGSVAFWLVGSLLVLRLAGYRLRWRAWRAEPQAENAV
jgi:hypothetical protein